MGTKTALYCRWTAKAPAEAVYWKEFMGVRGGGRLRKSFPPKIEGVGGALRGTIGAFVMSGASKPGI